MTDEIKETVEKYMKTLTMAQSSREEVENVICGYMLDLAAREKEIKTLKSHLLKIRSEARKMKDYTVIATTRAQSFIKAVHSVCNKALKD